MGIKNEHKMTEVKLPSYSLWIYNKDSHGVLIVEKDTFFIFATYKDNNWWESEIPKLLEE